MWRFGAWTLVATLGLALATPALAYAQVGNPVVQPPSSGTTINVPPPQVNVQVLAPPPDPALVASTAKDAAPAALEGGLTGLDQSGAQLTRGFLDLGGSFAGFRKDLTIDQPRVRDLNHTASRIVLAGLALAIAVVGLGGLLAQYVGSDAAETVELFLPIPLWALAALTSLTWFGFMMDGFGSVATALSGSTRSAIGPALGSDFASAGSTLAELVLSLAFLVLALLLLLRLWTTTVFLALFAAVAPLFVFACAVPGLKGFGRQWWRLTSGYMTDLLLISAVLALGGPVVGQLGQTQGAGMVLLRIGLVWVALRIPGLFGAANPGGPTLKTAYHLAGLVNRLRRGGR